MQPRQEPALNGAGLRPAGVLAHLQQSRRGLIQISGAELCLLPTRIVLSYLTHWAQRSRTQARAVWRRPLASRRRTTGQRGRCCDLYIGPAVVTRLEICCPLSGLLVGGPAPFGYSQPRAGRLATQCECGRGPSALAGTPNADSGAPRIVLGRQCLDLQNIQFGARCAGSYVGKAAGSPAALARGPERIR
jgi:hypothetical protein